MRKDNVHIVLLCEDERHAAFINQFLREKKRVAYRAFPDGYKGWEPGGVKPNNDFVLQRCAQEIRNARTLRRKCALIVVIDGDEKGFEGRLKEVNSRIQSENMPLLEDEDRIALIIPCRNIETWVHYFAGKRANETDDYSDLYPKRMYDVREEIKAFAEFVCDGNSAVVLDLPALDASRLTLRHLNESMSI